MRGWGRLVGWIGMGMLLLWWEWVEAEREEERERERWLTERETCGVVIKGGKPNQWSLLCFSRTESVTSQRPGRSGLALGGAS